MHPLLSIRSTSLVRSVIVILVFTAVLSGLAGEGCNGMSMDMTGCWQSESPNDMAVTLKVTADGVEMDFTGLACEAAGELIGTDENSSIYSVRAPTGGSLQGGCAKFREAQMILTVDTDGSLLMHITKPSTQLDEQMTLIKKSCD